MKIHTTQNLTSIRRNQDSTNSAVIPNDEIRLNYSEQMRLSHLLAEPDSNKDTVSFRGKGNPVKDGKKIVKSLKKVVGEVKENPVIDKKRGDNFM